MRRKARGAGFLALILAQCTVACALTSKSEPIVPRYFDLDQSSQAKTSSGNATEPGKQLNLGRIEAAQHLDERLVYRSSTREIGYYEEQRWSEQPREYLRRELARELYERRGLVRALSGPAPTLEVELSSFEEVRATPKLARVRLTYVLHDGSSVLLERTLTIERQVPRGPASQEVDSVVQAMAEAMRDAVHQVAADVVEALARVAAPTTPSPCPDKPITEGPGSE